MPCVFSLWPQNPTGFCGHSNLMYNLSITGSLLTGTFLRPDFTGPTEIIPDRTFLKPEGRKYYSNKFINLKINKLNVCGMIPIISTVTGTAGPNH